MVAIATAIVVVAAAAAVDPVCHRPCLGWWMPSASVVAVAVVAAAVVVVAVESRSKMVPVVGQPTAWPMAAHTSSTVGLRSSAGSSQASVPPW